MADPSSKSREPSTVEGKLLLAAPMLRDGIFDRSVILMTHHNAAEGAHGLILNQPTGTTVGDLLSGSEFAPLRNLSVHHGGPVSSEHLTFCSLWWSPKRGLQWAIRISPDEAADQVQKPGRIVRAFVGYSGWSAGQLEGELKRNSWIPIPPSSSVLGEVHDRSLWFTIMRAMSPLHRILAEAPRDPFLN